MVPALLKFLSIAYLSPEKEILFCKMSRILLSKICTNPFVRLADKSVGSSASSETQGQSVGSGELTKRTQEKLFADWPQ